MGENEGTILSWKPHTLLVLLNQHETQLQEKHKERKWTAVYNISVTRIGLGLDDNSEIWGIATANHFLQKHKACKHLKNTTD